MSEPTSVRAVMLPPPGFVESAVERGLAEVLAQEALREVEALALGDGVDTPENDISGGERPVRPATRRRRDSGIIAGLDDTPTLPFIRVAASEE